MKTLHFLLAAAMSVISSVILPAEEATLYKRGATYEESTMPPSPEPASVVKFADVPFTHSLGLAEYSIPIYTLEGRELSLPIGLHYASGGIKVDEIAGAAGLGWTLQAGGCITRTVVDLPDEFSAPNFRHQTPSGDLLTRLEVGTRDTINNAAYNYLLDLLQHKVDSGLDRYCYNVCGLSGTFVIGDDGKIVQLTGDGVKIAYIRDSEGCIDSFTITGPDGIVYTLSIKETATHKGRSETITSISNAAPDRWSATTAWHISEMRSRSGLETINFTYSEPERWDKDVYVSRQVCTVTGPYSEGESPKYSRESTYISSYYETRFLTGISFPGTAIEFEYEGCSTAVRHTGNVIQKYNCPVKISKILVTNSGNPSENIRAEFGTAQALYDGRIILNDLKFYRGGVLDDKWSFEYNELSHSISHFSQDWHGYYNGEHEYGDSGRNSLCPFELSARTSSDTAVSGIPNPEHSDYMSLSAVDHDGAKIYFDYEASTWSYNQKDYHVGIRVKRIASKSGFAVINPRYFTYENPLPVCQEVPTQDLYGTITGTIRVSGMVSLCDWKATLNEMPVAIGPSIRDARIVYGKITEDRGDRTLHLADYTAPTSNTARTVYIYDTSDVRPENTRTIDRFPTRWVPYYNSYGSWSIDPWMGVRKGYTCDELDRKALLTRVEEYAYEDDDYKLVSSVDYVYESYLGSSVLVDYRATQVMFKQQAGNVDYNDIYHFPVYAHSRMKSNPIKEVRVDYHNSGNDTSVVNTTYRSRMSFELPVRVHHKSITENGRERLITYTYADNKLALNWARELVDSNCLNIPITMTEQILEAESVQPQEPGNHIQMTFNVTELKEEAIEYDWTTINGKRVLLPSVHVEKTGGTESWRETVLSRNGLGNISSFKETGQPETVILWGYKGLLPVAVIRNATIEQVQALFSSTAVMDSFAATTKPMSEYNRILATLRTELPSAHVTTYTHIPGVGISSVTDEAGMVTTYEYDHAGRLACIKDNDGNKVEEYTYNLMSDSNGRKHMRSKVYRSEDETKYTEDVRWWDNLGRKTEDISIAASTSGRDLVTAYGSDFLLHDDVKTWMPYPASNTDGTFQTEAEQAAAQYHGNDKAYIFNEYELSNRGKVLSTALPGYAGVHSTSFQKDIASEFPILEWEENGVVENGIYDSSSIIIDRIVDADGRFGSTYKNHMGKILGTSSASNTPTYYIYDKLDQLRAVVNSGISFTDTLSMWRYSYDSQGRLKSKGVPNSVREFYTYDSEDRVVAIMRNGLLKELEYDDFGRVVKVYMTRNGVSKTLWEEHTYDTYPSGISGANPKGLLTRSKLAEVAPNGTVSGYTTISYSYDAKKRPTLVKMRYSVGNQLSVTTEYTFSGEAQSVYYVHEYNNRADQLWINYNYDTRGRKIYECVRLQTYNNNEHEIENYFAYDETGRPHRTQSVVNGGVAVESVLSYTLQGWIDEISATINGEPLFSQILGYDSTGLPTGISPQYSGLVSKIKDRWFRNAQVVDNSTKYYGYDPMGYLATEKVGTSTAIYSYDSRGNVLSESTMSESKTYNYSGERLVSIRITNNSSQKLYPFLHDALGRTIVNQLTGHSITYNDLDLVGNIKQGAITLVNYFYLADGTKIGALKANGEGLIYIGPFVYRKSSDGSLTFESVAFSQGRITATRPMIYVTDYLGNVRAVVDGYTGGLLKASDYSAFGEETAVAALQITTPPAGVTLRDGFTGQESQHTDFNTHYTDFGARQYFSEILRWMTPDLLSEKYYGTSPYAFCNNNPVNFVDPNGEHPIVVGAIVGGAISGTAAIINGKSFTEVVAATAGGVLDGAIATVLPGQQITFVNKIIKGTIGGGAGELLEQGLNVAFGNQENMDLKGLGARIFMGLVSTGTSESLESGLKSMAKSSIGSSSTYKTVEKEVKAKIKRTGRTPKPNEVKHIVTNEVKEIEEAWSETIEISVNALGYGIDFYNGILDKDE